MKQLLAEVKGIVDKYNKIDEVTGKNFNIFNVLEVNDKEVLICRFIFQLINPYGLHNQNSLFLKKFFDDVLGFSIDDDELKTALVSKELLIKNDRRIDLVIETKNRVIPIEVKIYANDQKNQCDDYLDWAINQNKDDYKLYYLTLDGHCPSEESFLYSKNKLSKYKCDGDIYEELKEKHVKCISFKDEIKRWIENCLEDVNVLDKIQIVDNLLQFLNTIKELCNMGNDRIIDDTIKIFENNPDNFKSYLVMKKCENYIKISVLKEIINSVIHGVENEIKEKFPLHNIKTDEIYDDNRTSEMNILCSGDRVGGKLPGFAVVCNKKYGDDEICVGIEIDKNGMYYEIYLKDYKVRSESKNVEIARIIDKEGKSDETWIWWEWCKFGSNDQINFRDPNDSFAELINKDNRAKFIKTIIEEIVNLYKTIEEKIV